MTRERSRYWDDARARDWGSAFVVALVLSVATLIAATAIAAFDNSARLTASYSTARDLPQTDGRAR